MTVENKSGEAGLKRHLGLGAATLAGVGVILGAGIYVLVGIAAGQAGNAVWLSFLFAAVAASLTGLSYARLSRLYPRNAPEFQYVSAAYGHRPGFLAGWMILWATIISAAAVSLGFAGYLSHLAGLPVLPSAIGLILFSSLVVFLGIGESTILAGILTIIEVGGLLFIIGIGMPHIGRPDYLEMPFGISGVISASSLVFFAYLGFENMANLSEEMKNPARDLPRAIFLAQGISTVFYILVSVSAISVLGWSDLSQSSAPMAEVAARVLGAKADLLMTFIALSSTANTVLILLLAASRAMWGMSCAGALPMTFCIIGENRRTPWLTIILVGIFTGLFAAIKDIESVAEFTNLVTLLVFAAVNASAVKIFGDRRSDGLLKHVFTGFIPPGIGVAVCLWLAFNTGWLAALLGAGLLVAGVVVYQIIKYYAGRGKG